MPAAVLATALVATTAAAADIVNIEWSAANRFESSVLVPAGRIAEVCGRLPAGRQVRWDFQADGALDFNIHYHAGKTVHMPVKQAAARAAQGVLTVGEPQDYCWMWTNKVERDLTLRLVLRQER